MAWSCPGPRRASQPCRRCWRHIIVSQQLYKQSSYPRYCRGQGPWRSSRSSSRWTSSSCWASYFSSYSWVYQPTVNRNNLSTILRHIVKHTWSIKDLFLAGGGIGELEVGSEVFSVRPETFLECFLSGTGVLCVEEGLMTCFFTLVLPAVLGAEVEGRDLDTLELLAWKMSQN